MGGYVLLPEDNTDLPYFTPERAHLLLKGIYRYYSHHKDGSHLDGRVTDHAIWKLCWRRRAVQLATWYATPSGAVGRRFTAILAAEWRGFLGRSWNSNMPLVFAHVIITKMFSVQRAKEIWEQITNWIDLWDRGIHTGPVWESEAEGDDREGRASSRGEDEDEAIARSYHDTVLSGKLRQAVHWATNRERGGCLLPDDQSTKIGHPVAEVLQ